MVLSDEEYRTWAERKLPKIETQFNEDEGF